MKNIFINSRLPDDIIASIVDRLPETIFSDPNLSNRDAVPYGLISKSFREALEKRSVWNFDAISDSKTTMMKHFEELIVFKGKCWKQQPEAFTITFELNNYLERYLEFINLVTEPRNTKRLKILKLSNIHGVPNFPPESIFRVESLEQLGLMGWSLNKEVKREIRWPNLKRLCLDSVIMDSMVFTGMMNSSPSLENLVIRNYKEPWEKPGHKMPGFKNLKTLHLEKCEGVDEGFFTNFARKFPRLEELCLQENPISRVSLSSCSLRKIRLVNMLLLKEAHFDVPKVVQFEFEGHYKAGFCKSNLLPQVSVKTRSEGWNSVIKLGCKSNLTEQLEKFKNGLDRSKISVILTSN